jgi:hypothetical protein
VHFLTLELQLTKVMYIRNRMMKMSAVLFVLVYVFWPHIANGASHHNSVNKKGQFTDSCRTQCVGMWVVM